MLRTQLQPVNAAIGDVSFFYTFGTAPTLHTSEHLRLRTHLRYVEERLRMSPTKHLRPAQKQKRAFLLDKLHEYWLQGCFPVNVAYQERRPCFIDYRGNICAVGYLIEQDWGRETAERINALHQYDHITTMDSRELHQWVAESGLSLAECAMIQPDYTSIMKFVPFPSSIEFDGPISSIHHENSEFLSSYQYWSDEDFPRSSYKEISQERIIEHLKKIQRYTDDWHWLEKTIRCYEDVQRLVNISSLLKLDSIEHIKNANDDEAKEICKILNLRADDYDKHYRDLTREINETIRHLFYVHDYDTEEINRNLNDALHDVVQDFRFAKIKHSLELFSGTVTLPLIDKDHLVFAVRQITRFAFLSLRHYKDAEVQITSRVVDNMYRIDITKPGNKLYYSSHYHHYKSYPIYSIEEYVTFPDDGIQNIGRLHGGMFEITRDAESMSISIGFPVKQQDGTIARSLYVPIDYSTMRPPDGYIINHSSNNRERTIQRILVIDDDVRLREFTIKYFLEKEGYEVITAENGEIGLSMAKEELPDLIICDVMMPKLNGLGVIQALHEYQQTASIPFILMFAESDRLNIRDAMNLGADDVLAKPFTRLELITAVDAMKSR